MLFSVHVLKPPLVSLPTPTRGKRNPSNTQSRAARALGASRSAASSHPGPYRGQRTPGTRLARAQPPSPSSAAPARPRGALSPTGERADPAPHLEAGARLGSAGERAAPEAAPARAAQVLGAAPGCFLPSPGGGDPRPAGAARAQRRGRRGRPSRFRSIAARLSQPARRSAAPAAQATWSASAQWGPRNGASGGRRGLALSPSRGDLRLVPTTRCWDCVS